MLFCLHVCCQQVKMDAGPNSPIRSVHTSLVYGWGNTNQGQLGLGGIEDEQIVAAREVSFLSGKPVKSISMGADHTIFLMQDGIVYSCGNNDFGQLGHDKARRRPGKIRSTASYLRFFNMLIVFDR
jgi:alpha-tubulin suppressor-like RCC1 family protein